MPRRRTVAEHAARIAALVGPTLARHETELIPLASALGRVASEPVVTSGPLPPFRNAQMDGYAARAADVRRGPVVLPVDGVVPAARAEPRTLEPGTLIRIMTGAPVPAQRLAGSPWLASLRAGLVPVAIGLSLATGLVTGGAAARGTGLEVAVCVAITAGAWLWVWQGRGSPGWAQIPACGWPEASSDADGFGTVYSAVFSSAGLSRPIELGGT